MRLGAWIWVCCVMGACVDTEYVPPRREANDAGPSPLERARGPEKPPPAPGRPVSMVPTEDADAGSPQLVAAGATARMPNAGTAAPPPPPMPEVVPAPTLAGQLVITELMIDPQTLSDSQGEWIELHNVTQRTFELRGCELDDGAKAAHAIELSLRIAPAGYATLARQANPGFTPSIVMPLSLTNSGDRVAIRCGGREIDRVSYDQSFPLHSGASLALDPTRLDDRSHPSAWCPGHDSYGPELGTPGAPNPSCEEDQDAGAEP